MLLPISDQNPIVHIRFQAITFLIIGACVAIYLWEATLPPTTEAELRFYHLAFVPARLFGTADGSIAPDLVWGLGSIASSMFLHGGFWHLLGNMLFLWVYGDNVEDATGHVRFVFFYLLCGVAAALAQSAADIHTAIPMIGASGAISGVLGAYLILHPRARILVMTFFFLTFHVRAMWLIGFWIAYQIVLGVMDDGKAGVAWWAHVGGFFAGAALIPVFKRRGVALFDGAGRGSGDPRKQSAIPRIPPRHRR
jgi:membrane associated rhomboid family serine protease